jgi:hypothetical protein
MRSRSSATVTAAREPGDLHRAHAGAVLEAAPERARVNVEVVKRCAVRDERDSTMFTGRTAAIENVAAGKDV